MQTLDRVPHLESALALGVRGPDTHGHSMVRVVELMEREKIFSSVMEAACWALARLWAETLATPSTEADLGLWRTISQSSMMLSVHFT